MRDEPAPLQSGLRRRGLARDGAGDIRLPGALRLHDRPVRSPSPTAVIKQQGAFLAGGLKRPWSYRQIFGYPNFLRAYGNTIFYTVAGTAIALLFTVMFAYPLSKPVVKGAAS